MRGGQPTEPTGGADPIGRAGAADRTGPAARADSADPKQPARFRTTLTRVLLVQIVALVLLWLLQATYHS